MKNNWYFKLKQGLHIVGKSLFDNFVTNFMYVNFKLYLFNF